MRQHLELGLGLIVATIVAYGLMGAVIYLRNIPSVIVTMGMSFVWVGIGYILQPAPGGQPPDWLIKVFNVHLVVPESVLIILVAGLISFLFCRSRYGTVLRGFGNNPVAVERSGWSSLKAYISAYAIASLFSVVGGMAMTASAAGSDINATASYTLRNSRSGSHRRERAHWWRCVVFRHSDRRDHVVLDRRACRLS